MTTTGLEKPARKGTGFGDSGPLVVADAEGGMRFDRWFRQYWPEISHGRLEKLVRTGQIRVDGKRIRTGTRLLPGQMIRLPPLPAFSPSSRQAAAGRKESAGISEKRLEKMRNWVLYRDDAVLCLDKPAGLAVQGGSGLRIHLDEMLDGLRFGAAERPRLVHRLDKDTSGVLVLGRSAGAAAALSRAFREKTVHKVYWAVTLGVPRPANGRITLPLAKTPGAGGERVRVDSVAGKKAESRYALLDQTGEKAALLALMPVTGRTHQLRVHCAETGMPILGDGKYGGRGAFPDPAPTSGSLARRLHLHARTINFPHPDGRVLQVTAPLPAHLAAAISFFGFTVPPEGFDPFVPDRGRPG